MISSYLVQRKRCLNTVSYEVVWGENDILKLTVKKLLAILLLAHTITLIATGFASTDAGRNCKFYFVIYGNPGCEFCIATNKTLNTLLPGCVEFASVVSNVTAAQIYYNLWDAIIRLPEYSVPLIVVYNGSRPVAFVLGWRPIDWWEQFIENLTLQTPKTALLCVGMNCRLLTLQEYRAAINALKKPVKIVYIVAYKGFEKELLESTDAILLDEVPPEAETIIEKAMELLNISSVRGYVIYCGFRPVVLLVDENVPHTITTRDKVVNVDELIVGRAAEYSIGKGNPIIAYAFMANNTLYVRIHVVTPNNTEIYSLMNSVCGFQLSQKSLMPLPALIVALIGLAAIDSINPCFLALYTTLVAASVSLGSSSTALATGLAIAIGVYTGYYLLGLGLSQALAILGEPLRLLLAIAMLALGFRAVGEALLREHSNNRECRVCRLVEERGRLGILSLYGLGLVASWTLLPCTAGPYVAAIILLGSQPLPLKLILLAIYNLVFIAPLIAILIGATKIVRRYEKLVPTMSVVAGIILIVLAVLIILESLDMIPPIV